MAKLTAIAGVVRAPFLLLPVTLVASGSSVAVHAGTFVGSRALVALLGLVALHAAVNALNEASDMRSGIDLRTHRTPFSGGSGTLPSGRMSERTARGIGYACFVVGLACGIWFLYVVGWSLLPLLLTGAVCVLAYSGLFARAGCGEIAAGLGLGALPVAGSAMVHDGRFGPIALALSIPALLMTFNLLLLNEFPDEVPDRYGGRRNLVLLCGRRLAARIYAAAALLTPLSILAATVCAVLPTVCALGALPSLLLWAPLRWALDRAEQPVPVSALAWNVVWNLATNLTLAVTLAFTAS